MKTKKIIVNGIQRPYITDDVLLGSWEAVQSVKASEITHRDTDTEVLSGMLFRGYEMKWGVRNTNGEVYEKTAFDKFIKTYFVDHELNMPCTIEHSYRVEDIVGRVLYIEVNTTGFYFVVYVPETCPRYSLVKWLAEQGLIQGFSKEGYVTDGEWNQDKDDEWYIEIREMMMTRISLVCTPANGVKFEKVQETRNSIAYVNTIEKTASCLQRIINPKHKTK